MGKKLQKLIKLFGNAMKLREQGLMVEQTKIESIERIATQEEADWCVKQLTEQVWRIVATTENPDGVGSIKVDWE